MFIEQAPAHRISNCNGCQKQNYQPEDEDTYTETELSEFTLFRDLGNERGRSAIVSLTLCHDCRGELLEALTPPRDLCAICGKPSGEHRPGYSSSDHAFAKEVR